MCAMVRASFALLVLCSAFAVRASVWFGDEDGLHRVDTAHNRADLNISSSEPVALSVNSTDGSVWALTRSRIAKYNPEGTRLFSNSLDSLADWAGDGRRLAVNAANGSAWIATERRLLHLSATGSLRSVAWSTVTDMAVAQDGTLWVLDEDDNELRRYADEGALMSRTSLGGASREAAYIALDDTRGALWLGGDHSLIKRSLSNPSSVLRTVTTSQTVSGMSLDVQTGELWVLGTSSFYGYRPDGTRFVSESVSNDGVTNAETIAFDIGTQAIWIGHRRGLTRFERDGDRVATIRADEVDTVAVSRAAVNIDPPTAAAPLARSRPAISRASPSTRS
jgi:ligand-binding sensor domain-containing protein